MNSRTPLYASVALALLFAPACGGDDTGGAAAPGNDAGGTGDSTTGHDGGTTGQEGGTTGDGATGRDSGGGDSGGGTDSSVPPVDAGVSVLQHHNHATRDGVFVDATLTKAAASHMHLDTSFAANVNGPVYAQPLYVEGAVGAKDALIVATEQNVVYAFDAASGGTLWPPRALATPVAKSALPCGNIDPLGVTGTPYVDLGSRTIYLDAMTTPDNGTTKRHLVYALSLDDGSVRPGWPVDIEAAIPSFHSEIQNQRGALLVLDGVLYVPFGGHYGDCGANGVMYHGWVVGVNVANRSVTSWSTSAERSGTWAPAGVSSDGTSLYVTTGNSLNASTWGGGDAVVRLAKGPVFSKATADYFAPDDWASLDTADLDLGVHALVDAPGITPQSLVLAFGKNGYAYILDHANLGGVGHELWKSKVATGPTQNEITAAITTFTTAAGTFVSFRVDGGSGATCPVGGGGNIATMKLKAGTPPTLEPVWCSAEDLALPVTSMTTPAGSEAIVWNVSTDRLYAYDAESGAKIFDGGVAGDQMASGVGYFQTPIIAKGRVFVAANSQLYAFSVK